MVSELLHEYQESVAYDEAFASYCGEVAKKFDAAVERALDSIPDASLYESAVASDISVSKLERFLLTYPKKS